METPEEIIDRYDLSIDAEMYHPFVEAMKEYAYAVAKEALKNASENALLVNKFGDDIGSFAFDEISNKIWISKQSILNESNIPTL